MSSMKAFGLLLVAFVAFMALNVTLVGTAMAADQAPSSLMGPCKTPVTWVVEHGYVVSSITYTQDQATGDFAGFLFTAEDDHNFYFAFAQSVFINDNTYDVNSIGWRETHGKDHRLKDLLQSEHMKVTLLDNIGAVAMDFFLDYATDQIKGPEVGDIDALGVLGGDGKMNVGDPADVTAWSSSLDWNFNNAVPTWPDKFDISPLRIPTNTYDAGTSADPASPWIYETVYEWAVAKSAFPQRRARRTPDI